MVTGVRVPLKTDAPLRLPGMLPSLHVDQHPAGRRSLAAIAADGIAVTPHEGPCAVLSCSEGEAAKPEWEEAPQESIAYDRNPVRNR